MSLAPETEAFTPETLARPEVPLRVSVGLASPLWGLFAGAAVSGAAWWWMTRWTRPQNLEALFGAAETMVDAEPETFAAPAIAVVEAVGTAAEATVEPVLEAGAEAVPELAAEGLAEVSPPPALETLTEAIPDLEPVGGESAPISPVVVQASAPESVEAAAEPGAAPKLRKKAALPLAADTPD